MDDLHHSKNNFWYSVRPWVFAILACLLLSVVSACTYATRAKDAVVDTTGKVIGPHGRVNLDLASTPKVYTDTKIQMADMMVMVQPNKNLDDIPTALFVPFGVTQDMRDADLVSQNVSYQLWQQILASSAFAALEMANIRPPYKVDMSLPMARGMGAEMLVGGYITYYYDGGKNSDSKISIQMEVYDVATGNLLWAVAHAAVMPYQTYRDFILLEWHSRRPQDPMGALIQALGADFGQLMHLWASSNSYGQTAASDASSDERSSQTSAFGTF